MKCAAVLLLLVPANAFLAAKVKQGFAESWGGANNEQVQMAKEVQAIIHNMTLGEKIAQMLQIEAGAVDAETYLPYVGAVLYEGNHQIGQNTAQEWYKFAHNLQHQAMKGPHKVPIFIGSDSVHGQSHLKKTTIFPHNINLGCSRNKTLVEMVARVTAKESAATGINYIFAPCLDVVHDVRWGRTYESFSQDPQLVNELGSAFVDGAQSVDTGLITSAKHFVAAGATKFGTGNFIEPEEVTSMKDDMIKAFYKSHKVNPPKHYEPKVNLAKLPRKPLDRGDAQLDHAELYTKHLLPYWGAVSAGTGSVMTSYSSVNGIPNHANKELLDYLKGKGGMNFEGFVITDYAGIDMLNPDYKVALPKAINAGIDMVMLPGTEGGCHPWNDGVCPTAQSFVKDMIKMVQAGTITEDRVNDAAFRIIMSKKKHGLFEQALAPEKWLKEVGSDEHMQLAREAAQQGTVVLTNNGQALPLSKKDKICVAGDVADDLGMQLGGWSVKWQGFKGNQETTGTTFWGAVNGKGLEGAFYDKTGKCEGADTVVAVVGEHPYAEGYGDAKSGLHLRKEDKQMLANAFGDSEKKAASLLESEAAAESEDGAVGRRVILVTMAGRPQWMEEEVKRADAFVASFVPGVMGGPGVLDVLLGDVKPTGKLSVTWPMNEKAPVNEHSPSEEVLFEMGSGLTYDTVHQEF